jgi:hypothetical protein
MHHCTASLFCGIYSLPLFACFRGRLGGHLLLQLQPEREDAMKHQNAPPRAGNGELNIGHGLHSVAGVANGRRAANTTAKKTVVLGIDI